MTHFLQMPVLGCLATILLSAESSAQVGVPPDSMQSSFHAVLAGAPAPVSRVEAGQLSRDLRPDLVGLAGDQVAVAFAVGVHDSAALLPTTTVDFALLPGAAANGCTGVVTVDASGLQLWTADTQGGVFLSRPVGSAAFANATRLRAADVNVDGEPDLVALMADQHTLRVLYSASTGDSESTIAFAPTVHDFVVLNWDFGPALEYALLTSNGVVVVRNGGATVSVLGFGQAGDLMCVQPLAAGAYDRLAVLSRAGQADNLWIASRDGSEAPVSLGGNVTVGMASGDLTGDGAPELVLSRQLWLSPMVLTHQPSAPSYSAASGNHYVLSIGSEQYFVTSNQAQPAIADFDQDSDLDVAFPVQTDQRLAVWDSTPIDAAARRVGVAPLDYDYSTSTGLGTIALRVTPPLTTAFTPTHLEVTVWNMAHIESTLEQEATAHLFVPVSWSGGFQDIALNLLDRLEPMSAYPIEVRPVVFDSVNQRVAQVGPTHCSALAYTQLSVPVFDATHGCGPGVHTVFNDPGYPPEHGTQGHESALIPTFVELDEMPDFEDDAVPAPHDEGEAPYGQ